MSSDQFSPTHPRRVDPALRFSNLSDIRSIISRYENNDRVVSVTRTSPSRPVSYGGEGNMIYTDRGFPIETMPYSDSTERGFQSGVYYYDDVDVKPAQLSRFGAINMLMQFVLGFLKCWMGMGTISFALICVVVSIFAPRILTELFIYPCCRLLFGTLYPAYASYKAIRTKNVKEYVKWMMYWIVFALFTCAETFTDVFLSWLPFYYEIKIILVFWLLSPATKGSSILYRKFVHPALCRREQEIDECISKAKEQGYHTVLNLGSRGVNYATNVIMQTALKSGGGLVQQLRKSYSLSDLTASEDHSDGHSQQEIDEAGNVMGASDPRLVRRTVSVRGRSPRTFNSSKVDMAFPEMDVCVGHARPIGRDMVNLNQIRSSEDISSSYVPENVTDQDLLMRTSSVGGSTRMRSKVTRSTFTSIKRPGAAEDDEVIIEEVDDRQSPYPLDYLTASNNADSGYIWSSGAVNEPPIDINQYLSFIERNDVSNSETNNDIELNYKKYLALKKIFESQEKDEKKYIENELPTVIDTASNKTPDIHINDEKKVDTEKTEMTNLDKDSILNVHKSENNDENVKKDEIIKECIESSDVSNTEVKDATVKTSPEEVNIESDVNFSNAGSLLSLSSINESSDSDFTSRGNSPRLDSSAKNKKRRAPPPPAVNKTLVTDEPNIGFKLADKGVENDSTSVDKIDVNTNKSNLIEASKVSTENISSAKTSNTAVTEENLSESDRTPKKNKANKESKSKKSKPDSSISKLLNLPSKLAFWSKTDEDANKSNPSDISVEKESNVSVETMGISDKSNINSIEDISNKNNIIEIGNIITLQKLSTSLDSLNDAFEDASEVPLNDEVLVAERESEKKVEKELKDSEKNTTPVNERRKSNTEKESEDVQYIPLKLETPVLHTESKSTDV